MVDDFRGRVHLAFKEHDRAINSMHHRFKEVERGADKVYLQNLTHVMMWDVLMGLLEKRGIITKNQFDEALKELSDKTQAAMAEEQKKRAEAEELAKGKVTVTSDVPAIPVVK